MEEVALCSSSRGVDPFAIAITYRSAAGRPASFSQHQQRRQRRQRRRQCIPNLSIRSTSEAKFLGSIQPCGSDSWVRFHITGGFLADAIGTLQDSLDDSQ